MLVLLKFEKETKGTVRYTEVDEAGVSVVPNAVIGTLYIRKSALGGLIPPSVTVEVTLNA